MLRLPSSLSSSLSLSSSPGDVEAAGLSDDVLESGVREAGQLLLHHHHQLLQVAGGEDPGASLLQQTHAHLAAAGVSIIQGVPKKTLFLGFLAITPLWKGLEIKVGGVSKTSGNSLCDRHKNFTN